MNTNNLKSSVPPASNNQPISRLTSSSCYSYSYFPKKTSKQILDTNHSMDIIIEKLNLTAYTKNTMLNEILNGEFKNFTSKHHGESLARDWIRHCIENKESEIFAKIAKNRNTWFSQQLTRSFTQSLTFGFIKQYGEKAFLPNGMFDIAKFEREIDKANLDKVNGLPLSSYIHSRYLKNISLDKEKKFVHFENKDGYFLSMNISQNSNNSPLNIEASKNYLESIKKECDAVLEYADKHKINFESINIKINPEKFNNGGKHKTYHDGILRAKDKTGENDFVSEGHCHSYIQSISNEKIKEAMIKYTSFQEELNGSEIDKKNLDKNFRYAKVDTYDQNHVEFKELYEYIKNGKLSKKDLLSVAMQLIRATIFNYLLNLKHGDLHMKNMMLLRKKDSEGVAMKLIDFGKSRAVNPNTQSKNGQFIKRKSDDIRYIFLKQRSTLGENLWDKVRKTTGFNSASEKHYPLHKIFLQLGVPKKSIDYMLKQLGNRLLSENLTHVTLDYDSVNEFSNKYKTKILIWYQNYINIDELGLN